MINCAARYWSCWCAAGALRNGHVVHGLDQVATEDAYVQADIAAIATKLSGYVASRQVPDNQTVKSGDVLLTLDTDDIRLRLA